MANTTRTFVALEVPPDRREAIRKLQAQLAPEIPGAKWVEPGQLHLTLAFLGDVDVADLAGVCRAIGEAAGAFATLDLRLEGVGAFPDARRPKVVWAGLSGPDVARLTDLHRAVAAASREAGYPPDGKFHPHVTLARVKPVRGPSPDLTAPLNRQKGWTGGAMPAREVVTFSSTLRPEGPVYAALSRTRLAGKRPPSPP